MVYLGIMDTIDKKSLEFIKAQDAVTEKVMDHMINPPDGPGALVKKRQRPSEIQFFLKNGTLPVLERLMNIATDSLYSRDENGQRHRIAVPPGVQLQASIAFLDRAMGKPTIAVDVTSGDRPIMFDSAFQAKPLIQAVIETPDSMQSESGDEE